MTASTLVAPDGWWALADAATYYPDDLPPEWHLTYFANEHSAVFVPADHWQPLSAQALADHAADVHTGFRFFPEAGPTVSAADRARAAAALGATLGAFVVTPAQAVEAAGDEAPQAPLPLITPEDTRDRASEQAFALHCPRSLNGDPRGARAWLDAAAKRLGEPPRLVILRQPSSTELARWRDLLALLGLG